MIYKGIILPLVMNMVNLERLDAKIAKMAKLRELLSDPEMAQLAREVLANAESNRMPEVPVIVELAFGKPNSLIRNALAAVETFKGRFTAQELKERMAQKGYKFKAANPMIGLQRLLRQFSTEGYVERVGEGAGRKPHIYESRLRKRKPEDRLDDLFYERS